MQIIDGWIENQRKNEISPARLRKYKVLANTLGHMAGKDLDAVLDNMKLLEGLVEKINRSHYEAWTKSDFKTLLRQLWKFKHGLDQDDKPREIKWIKTGVPSNQVKLPKGLVTDDEVKAMLKAARSPRDRAVIMLLHECGLRISELCALKKSDMEFIEQGVRIHVPENTKTGSRSILGIDCAPFLANWLANHPSKEADGFLFVGPHWVEGPRKKKLIYAQVGDRAIAKMLREVAWAAGIRKRIYPHLFRHGAATKLAKFLTEQELKVYLGWTANSNMASIYVHLSGKDVDDSLLRMHGQLAPKKQEDKLTPIFCERCNRKNSHDAERCDKCGLPFDKEAAVKDMISMQAQLEAMQAEQVASKKNQVEMEKKLEKLEEQREKRVARRIKEEAR